VRIHGAKPRSDPGTIKARLVELDEAFQIAFETLHKFDGTQADAPFGVRDMAIAGNYLQTAYLWAKRSVEEN
jgi:hypothetical protein